GGVDHHVNRRLVLHHQRVRLYLAVIAVDGVLRLAWKENGKVPFVVAVFLPVVGVRLRAQRKCQNKRKPENSSGFEHGLAFLFCDGTSAPTARDSPMLAPEAEQLPSPRRLPR